MSYIIEIESLDTPGVEIFSNLTRAQLKNCSQYEEGIFIAEGITVIGHALDSGYEPVALLMERKHITGKARDIVSYCDDIPVYTGESSVLTQLTGFALTRGVLGAFKRPKLPSVQNVCKNAKRIAVLEDIIDPSNIGAIFRSAAALGMDGVLVTPSCCDVLHRRAVRVSMGTIFQVPWTVIGESAEDWPYSGMKQLHEMGFKTAAMALDARAVSLDNGILAEEENLAIILGTEGDGLKTNTIAECDYTVCIPMQNGVDSLNVAAAAAVTFWELRKR